MIEEYTTQIIVSYCYLGKNCVYNSLIKIEGWTVYCTYSAMKELPQLNVTL